MVSTSPIDFIARDPRVPVVGFNGAVFVVLCVGKRCACWGRNGKKNVCYGARATGSTRCGKLGPGRSQLGGTVGEGIGASGARTTLPTTGYDGASKHQGNAFATHPLNLKNENKSNSSRTSHLMLKLIQINLTRRFKANQIWSVLFAVVWIINTTKRIDTWVVLF